MALTKNYEQNRAINGSGHEILVCCLEVTGITLGLNSQL